MAVPARIQVVRHGRLPNEVYYERISALKYCRENYGAREYEMRSDRPYEFRYSQKQAELNILASLLIAAGYNCIEVWPSERPDFTVTTSASGTAFVEVAEVVDQASARYHNTITNLKFQVMQDHYEDPGRRSRMDGKFLSFLLPDVPRRGILHRYRSEVLRFADEEDFTALPVGAITPVPSSYVALNAGAVTFFYRPGSATAIDITSTACSFNPADLAANALKLLARKQSIAADYEGSPLWLVLALTEMSAWPAASLDILADLSFDIAPFEKLIIGDQSGALEYTRQSSMTDRSFEYQLVGKTDGPRICRDCRHVSDLPPHVITQSLIHDGVEIRVDPQSGWVARGQDFASDYFCPDCAAIRGLLLGTA